MDGITEASKLVQASIAVLRSHSGLGMPLGTAGTPPRQARQVDGQRHSAWAERDLYRRGTATKRVWVSNTGNCSTTHGEESPLERDRVLVMPGDR